MKFYWQIVVPICLDVIYGCFCVTTAKLNNGNRNHMVHKPYTIHYLTPYRKSLLTPGLTHWYVMLLTHIFQEYLGLHFMWRKKITIWKLLDVSLVLFELCDGRRLSWLFSFYRWEKWDSKKLIDLSRVISQWRIGLGLESRSSDVKTQATANISVVPKATHR